MSVGAIVGEGLTGLVGVDVGVGDCVGSGLAVVVGIGSGGEVVGVAVCVGAFVAIPIGVVLGSAVGVARSSSNGCVGVGVGICAEAELSVSVSCGGCICPLVRPADGYKPETNDTIRKRFQTLFMISSPCGATCFISKLPLTQVMKCPL
jgi:hypothetical protein